MLPVFLGSVEEEVEVEVVVVEEGRRAGVLVQKDCDLGILVVIILVEGVVVVCKEAAPLCATARMIGREAIFDESDYDYCGLGDTIGFVSDRDLRVVCL